MLQIGEKASGNFCHLHCASGYLWRFKGVLTMQGTTGACLLTVPVTGPGKSSQVGATFKGAGRKNGFPEPSGQKVACGSLIILLHTFSQDQPPAPTRFGAPQVGGCALGERAGL